MLVLARDDLEKVLTPADVVDALADAFACHAQRRTLVPARTAVQVTDDGVLILMPASMAGRAAARSSHSVASRVERAAAPSATREASLVSGDGALGTKLVTFYANNRARGCPTIHGLYTLMDRTTGKPLAVVEGTYLTAMRTGATSALAARFMAREDAHRVTCFGAGVQAEFQLRALLAVRPIRDVTVVGRDATRAHAFAKRMTASLGVPVTASDDSRGSVKRAHIVTCATTSSMPVVHGADLAPGTHVDLVGAFTPSAREADTEAVRRARVVVDAYEGALAEAGDVLIPLGERVIDRDHIVAELSEIVVGARRGRTSDDDITLFKSVGFALEDLAAARLAYERATARGIGTEVRW